MSEIMRIGGISVEPGEKKSGLLTIGERAALTVDLPFTVINGASPGTVLCITAGNHGSEYAGIDAAIRLRSSLDPAKTSGTVIVVPIVNLPAFQERASRVCPIDGININRVYPGKQTGTISYLIAYAIFNQFVLKADFALDLHGGDLYESIQPFIVMHKSDSEALNEKEESLARAYAEGGDMKLIWEMGTGIISGSLAHQAVESGIPGITAEAGEAGRLEEKYVSVHLNGISNVMKSLHMIEGKMKTPKVKPKVVRGGTWLYAKRGGLFHLFKELGTIVSKGEALGEIRNINNKTVETILAPTDGVIICAETNPVKNVGDKIITYTEI